MITFRLITSNQNKETKIQSLICKIDEKLSCFANYRRDEIRFGLYESKDWDIYYDLITYKNILDSKLENDNCLCSYTLDDIIKFINKTLNTIC